jgi:CO/xanthine dehydrogenase Mo-binding subunit
MEFTTACDETGKLTAMKAVLIADSGAYASLGGPVLQRACTHAAGPYNYQNIDILGISVYTNNVVAAAYRGFGVTQELLLPPRTTSTCSQRWSASRPGKSATETPVRPGQELPKRTARGRGLRAGRMPPRHQGRLRIQSLRRNCLRFQEHGKGIGIRDTGRCKLSIESGLVHIRTSAACMGQGIATVCTQIICEQTGLDPKLLLHERGTLSARRTAGTSTASRQTVITGEAARKAGEALQKALESGKTLADLEGQEFIWRVMSRSPTPWAQTNQIP